MYEGTVPSRSYIGEPGPIEEPRTNLAVVPVAERHGRARARLLVDEQDVRVRTADLGDVGDHPPAVRREPRPRVDAAGEPMVRSLDEPARSNHDELRQRGAGRGDTRARRRARPRKPSDRRHLRSRTPDVLDQGRRFPAHFLRRDVEGLREESVVTRRIEDSPPRKPAALESASKRRRRFPLGNGHHVDGQTFGVDGPSDECQEVLSVRQKVGPAVRSLLSLRVQRGEGDGRPSRRGNTEQTTSGVRRVDDMTPSAFQVPPREVGRPRSASFRGSPPARSLRFKMTNRRRNRASGRRATRTGTWRPSLPRQQHGPPGGRERARRAGAGRRHRRRRTPNWRPSRRHGNGVPSPCVSSEGMNGHSEPLLRRETGGQLRRARPSPMATATIAARIQASRSRPRRGRDAAGAGALALGPDWELGDRTRTAPTMSMRRLRAVFVSEGRDRTRAT